MFSNAAKLRDPLRNPFSERVPVNDHIWAIRARVPEMISRAQEFISAMKRVHKDQLTGGTNDVNPQILTISPVQTAADTTTIVQQPLPIPRYPTGRDKNLVMEFLAIDYYKLNQAFPVNTGVTDLITVTTNPTAFGTPLAALQDGRLIDAWLNYHNLLSVSGYLDVETHHYSDLTDQAGHGILVATDNLYLGVYSIASALANQYVVKIWYRWKEVSLSEYIGIVQSQQG